MTTWCSRGLATDFSDLSLLFCSSRFQRRRLLQMVMNQLTPPVRSPSVRKKIDFLLLLRHVGVQPRSSHSGDRIVFPHCHTQLLERQFSIHLAVLFLTSSHQVRAPPVANDRIRRDRLSREVEQRMVILFCGVEVQRFSRSSFKFQISKYQVGNKIRKH